MEGPTWSWTRGALETRRLALALGWAHERTPPFVPPDPEAVASWRPPAVEEVHAFRRGPATRLAFFEGAVGATSSNNFVAAGLQLRRDRDRLDRRAGLGAGLSLELRHGIDDGSRGNVVVLSPTGHVYVVPQRLALIAEPARVSVGALGGHALAGDLAGRLGLALDLGAVEAAIESPPLSYLTPSRSRALPFSVRIGLMLE
jgi:hypothetical protein